MAMSQLLEMFDDQSFFNLLSSTEDTREVLSYLHNYFKNK